jgi:MFS family permease
MRTTEDMIARPVARQLTGQRGRMTVLCSGVALMNAAMAVASVTSTLVSGGKLGMAWASLPNTIGIVGTGLGAVLITRLTRRGRRYALLSGYLAASLGACLGIWAVLRGDALMLCGAMLLLGLGNAGAQLSRYAAAEEYPVHRRGSAIGLVVWAAAAGAVGGPLLLAFSGSLASGAGLAALSGPFILAAVVCAAAALAASAYRSASAPGPGAARTPTRALLRAPLAGSSLATMITAQVVMVAVMTATPVDMRMHGSGLGMVGMIVSAHTLGMFALSPVTGWMCDRFGARPVMLAGLVMLVASAALAAIAVPPVWPGAEGHPMTRAVALFLLGYAWNLCFLGGSSQLAAGLPSDYRADVEGVVDGIVWSAAAAASLVSTMIMAATGYPALVLAGGGFAGLAAMAASSMSRRRTGLPPMATRRCRYGACGRRLTARGFSPDEGSSHGQSSGMVRSNGARRRSSAELLRTAVRVADRREQPDELRNGSAGRGRHPGRHSGQPGWRRARHDLHLGA